MSADWPRVPPGDVLRLSLDPVDVSPEQVYPTFGVFGFGRGLFDKPPVNGAEISAAKLFRVRADQFVYSRLKAFEGAFGLVPHISSKDIERLPFTPPALSEQRRIVAPLDALQAKVDTVKPLQAETMTELDAILPALLNQAFAGRL